MKFGKRLGAEAARGWRGSYLDYKACKRAIRKDVEAGDVKGQNFEAAIRLELQKISAFFVDREEELEAAMQGMQGKPPQALAAFRAEVQDLRKYVVLNYIAVIKAVKKRNRHLRQAVGHALQPLRATDLLSQQYFFTSSKLAALSTQAEVLSKELPSREEAAAALQEYECPICLGVLQNPVVLTCTHRFCWGCLLAHCATALEPHSHGSSHDEKDTKHGHGRLLSAISEDSSVSTTSTYGCPVCRKAHILDLDRLQVDPHLTGYIESLKLKQVSSTELQQTTPPQGSATKVNLDAGSTTAPSAAIAMPSARQGVQAEEPSSKIASFKGMGLLAEALQQPEQEAPTEAAVEAEEAAAGPSGDEPLLPPQAGEMKGRLTVVLDLDGTLISSFTPRRAPSLPPGVKSYVVGRGAKLNPMGVLVVERPELAAFFSKLNEFAEVVLFTAGLEDYAAPICDALEKHYGAFTARLYRPATVACDVYPCVKDLSRLGRDLRRTVLVDDTPLAFLRQPDNGVPVFNFRGDVDDRVLPEAILPLLEALTASEDVRPILHRRFDMPRWLASHGITSVTPATKPAGLASPVKRRLALTPSKTVSETARSSSGLLNMQRGAGTLILTDFDKTLTDFDAGDHLVGELAPELAPMLANLQQPANFVPLTNAVLAEMARRGISRDKILTALRAIGSELPVASVQMLHWAFRQGIDVRIISDCNTVFINHILTGAKVNTMVKETLTNLASFERSMASDSASDLTTMDTWGRDHAGHAATAVSKEATHRLVIQPRHDENTDYPHNCPLCPTNLCKGLEVDALRMRVPYKRVIYCGDGANDLCPSLRLTTADVVLARKGYDLDTLIRARAADDSTQQRVVAEVHTWETHAELLKLVQRLVK